MQTQEWDEFKAFGVEGSILVEGGSIRVVAVALLGCNPHVCPSSNLKSCPNLKSVLVNSAYT